MPMIETKFHLFQIQQEVAAPDPIIAPQLVLDKRPEALNAIDVVPFSGEDAAPVIDPVVPVAVGDEAIVASEGIRIDRASLRHFLPDDETRDIARDIGHGASVDPAIPLEKAEYRDFSGCPSPASPFADAAEIGLVNLDFATQRSLALAFQGKRRSDAGIDSLLQRREILQPSASG